MDKETISKLKQKLESEKAQLEKELKSFSTEDKGLKNSPDRENVDMEEEADEVRESENLASLENRLGPRLKNVNAALEKIKNETYGKCETCGKEIEENRLAAFPEAKTCIKCNG